MLTSQSYTSDDTLKHHQMNLIFLVFASYKMFFFQLVALKLLVQNKIVYLYYGRFIAPTYLYNEAIYIPMTILTSTLVLSTIHGYI